GSRSTVCTVCPIAYSHARRRFRPLGIRLTRSFYTKNYMECKRAYFRDNLGQEVMDHGEFNECGHFT
uniref:Uncharacterized protein n=1 Tax=Romanomermis culicivorax TaxID=13658 RepID=A0A915L1J9_ROMCU